MSTLRRSIVSALLCLLLLWQTGCSAVNLMGPDILRPPRFTEEQGLIYDALSSWIYETHGSGFTLVYPVRGGAEYRSAFLPFNFNRAGGIGDVMLCFYQPERPLEEGDYRAWIAVLKKQQDGGWNVVYSVVGEGTAIDRVEPARVSSPDSDDLIVGWSSVGASDKMLTILAQGESRLLTQVYEGRYDEFEVVESARRGLLNDIVTLSLQRERQAAQAALIGLYLNEENGREEVAEKSTAPLNPSVYEYAQIARGMSGDGFTSIVADGLIDGESGRLLTTDVIEVREDALNNLTYNSDPTRNLTPMLERPPGFYSGDVNHDSELEIPRVLELVDPEGGSDVQKIYLRLYQKIVKGALVEAAQCVFNNESQYVFTYPDHWVPMSYSFSEDGVWQGITITEGRRTNEWHFIKYWDSEGESIPQPIMTIRVTPEKEQVDRFDSEEYELVATKWGNDYYVSILETETRLTESGVGVLGITMEEFRAHFQLFR